MNNIVFSILIYYFRTALLDSNPGQFKNFGFERLWIWNGRNFHLHPQKFLENLGRKKKTNKKKIKEMWGTNSKIECHIALFTS